MNRIENDPLVVALKNKFDAKVKIMVDFKKHINGEPQANFFSPSDYDDSLPSDTSFEFGVPAEPQEPCMSRLICTCCGKKYGHCSEIQQVLIQYEKENDQMINRTSNPVSPITRPSRGVQYLTVNDLGPKPLPTEIMATKIAPDTFKGAAPGAEVVVVKIKIGGSVIRLWTLRANNPNLNVICDALGDDETKWPGATLELFTEEDNFDQKLWIRSRVLAGKKGRS